MAMRILNPSSDEYLLSWPEGLLARDGFGTVNDLYVSGGTCVKEVLSPYTHFHNWNMRTIVYIS